MDSAKLDELEQLANNPKCNFYGIIYLAESVPELITENRELRERVRELERQRVELAELAIYGNGCFDCPLEDVCLYKEELVRDSEVCSRLLIEWVEKTTKEASDD